VLHDRSELLGLGETVDSHGEIPRESLDRVVDALLEYRGLAREASAEMLTLIGTEPLRRASNAERVTAWVKRATGLTLRVITIRQEAELTFLGVTGGQPPPEPLVVVDIGGGSTEIGVYAPGMTLDLAALPIGSARLTSLVVEHDPPTDSELDRLHQVAAGILSQLPDPPPDDGLGRPTAIFVGGTATNIARLGRLTRGGLAEDRRTIARMPSVAITELFGVRPQRARQLAAGAAIVGVLLEHYGLDEARVSTASLRDGAIIAGLRFGEAWPDHLDEMIAAPLQAR
jgi:exopolyphosphatase/guanosine-5'-triphosphate,3'-diphosphate pyrophosphatase